jgi:hypothetical protein
MPKKFNVVVENSAPSQVKPAYSVETSSAILRDQGVKNIVDFGCGRLRNLSIFRKHFSQITLVDTKLQCERISSLFQSSPNLKLFPESQFLISHEKYDAIFVISVLHIIPNPQLRRHILSVLTTMLSTPGYLVVDVPTAERYYRHHQKEENKYQDGWVMGSGPNYTFYKNFVSIELDKLVQSTTGLNIFQKIQRDKHLIRIWHK